MTVSGSQLTQALIEALQVDRSLLLDFFVAFSRFECALNAHEFVYPGSAIVSWSLFAKWLEGLPREELDPVLAAGNDLTKKPPKRLVRGDQGLAWEDVSKEAGESEIRFLVGCLTRARNNLFHGGKYLTAPDPAGRNRWVISNGLAVLFALVAIPSAESIRRLFQEDLP